VRAWRNDDRGRGFAPQFLEPLHRVRERLFRVGAEVLHGFLEGLGGDFEAQRQGACRRQHLRLSHIQDRAARIGIAVPIDGRQALQRADPAIRERFLAIQRRAVHADVLFGAFVCHASPRSRVIFLSVE